MSALVPLLVADSTQDPCASPGCRKKRGHGLWGVFCKPCAANLARIRDMFDTETAQRRRDWSSKGNGLRTVHRGPECCKPGCVEPRTQGHTYCAVCRAIDPSLEDEAA